ITRVAPKGSRAARLPPPRGDPPPMTVAAAVLAARPASALADAAGTPGARRIVDIAWSGGATPVVVCSFDPDGVVAAALANAEVTIVDPVHRWLVPLGQVVNGRHAA